MGIKRTVEWSWVCPPEEAPHRLLDACTRLDMEPHVQAGVIHASVKRSLRRNRWAADLTFTISADPAGGTRVAATVDAAGNKHFELLDEVIETLGDGLFADQGLAAAIARLGGASRLFGRKEIRHLHHLLYAGEVVHELGQGVYDGQQGLVVLTDQRLFFFEKSLGSERVETFPTNAISSMNVSKSMGGETLTVYASSNTAEIKQMMHGQADALSRAFRGLAQAAAARSQQPAPASQASASAPDPLAQLERLADLRDRGIVSAEEFEAKKAELMRRL